MGDKRGQLTIFIIIAVIVVSAVAGYFLFRSSVSDIINVPLSLEPVYTTFKSCIEDKTQVGIDLLETNGGYIDLPDFEPGSDYMPFSNQLNFLGNGIPYWYYISGNNIEKEQVPSKSKMENQLGKFIENNVESCNFEKYYDEGFLIDFNPENFNAEVTINKNDVSVNLKSDLKISKKEDSAVVGISKIRINSDLGKLYENAVKVYENEQETLFLENYSIDTLRLYAPVDGVELTCGTKVWQADKVFNQLKEAIEANTLALKSFGKKDDYFNLNLPIDSGIKVNFMNSRNWTNSFEVNPSEGSVLISKPVGNQPGLGVMGFCYVPYHFVYDIKYPVLIRLTSEKTNEIFQFPQAVIIRGNKPRKSLDVSAVDIELPKFCNYKNSQLEVRTYDTKLNFIDSKISYECFRTTCDIGETKSGVLNSKFPQCVNGNILVEAKGFKNSKYIYSTIDSNEEGVDIILDKLYEMKIELNLDNRLYNGEAIISFISDDSESSKTIVYPSQNSVNLSEGQYEIQVQVFKNSSLKLEANNIEQCVEVSRSGVGGLLGLTKKECFNTEIPEQIISNSLAGGGNENYYILESELESSNTIEINAESLSTPKTIEELQNNYILFEDKDLNIIFK